ncbi:MAG: SPOR domain-containing protein, partial [Mesorhizobium sp.]
MADRTQLRAAAQNDIADDDPFAELTRIMGFDPRQPVKPAFEPAATDAVDDELAASLEQDFLLDDDAADETAHAVAADDARSGVAEASAPAVEAAFDDDFDDALASSLEDVSPFEDDLAGNDKLGNDELAASLEQD